MSSPETRAAKRDYWNSKRVTFTCKALDVLAIWTVAIAFAVLASLNSF